jgi:hypothetical protein
MHRRLAGSLLLVVGCAHARAERAYIVSSEPSYYSPVLRLAIAVDTTADSILVRIDSGTIRVQGLAPSPHVAMRNLTLEGIIARKPAPGASGGELVSPWSALTVSQPTKLVDSLLFGIPLPVRPMRLSILRPQDTDLRHEWLVFRIRGDALTDSVRLPDGRVVAASFRQGGIRVFACSDRNLAGTLDESRAERLATEYASVC